jgi:hypothetical protein
VLVLVLLEEEQRQGQEEVVCLSESLVPSQILWKGQEQEHLGDGCLMSSPWL